MSSPLILLFGMPRSGTTWLGKIFDSHPEIEYLHEPDSERPLTSLPLLIDEGYKPSNNQEIPRLLQELSRKPTLRVHGKSPVFKKYWRGVLPSRVLEYNLMLSKVAQLVGLSLPLFFASPREKDVFPKVWKSIESVGRMSKILNIYPEAKGVLLIRHPCGHVASVLNGQKKNAFSAEGNIEEDRGILDILANSEFSKRLDLTLERLKTSTPAERIAWRWLIFNEHALVQLKNHSRVKVLAYEDLCANPIGVSQELFEFCGLSWDFQTESFVGQSVQSDEESYYGVFKDPLKAANKWKQTLDVADIDDIMNLASGSLSGKLFDI